MSWQAFEQTHQVVTRKAHHCAGCRRLWPKGVKLWTWSGVDKPYPPSRTYMCAICMVYMDRHRDDYEEYLPLFGFWNEDPDGYAEIERELEMQVIALDAGVEFVMGGWR